MLSPCSQAPTAAPTTVYLLANLLGPAVQSEENLQSCAAIHSWTAWECDGCMGSHAKVVQSCDKTLAADSTTHALPVARVCLVEQEDWSSGRLLIRDLRW